MTSKKAAPKKAAPKKVRRASISLKTTHALIASRVLVKSEKLVYILVANKSLNYNNGSSKIAYIGTTKNGSSRVAQSVATRADAILSLHGVTQFEARIITCRPRQHVKTWIKLERALLLKFRELFGEIPRCNKQGKNIKEEKEFELFARTRVGEILKSLST